MRSEKFPQETAAEVRAMMLDRLDYFTLRAFEVLGDVFDPAWVELRWCQSAEVKEQSLLGGC
jgi:hypothetical protein